MKARRLLAALALLAAVELPAQRRAAQVVMETPVPGEAEAEAEEEAPLPLPRPSPPAAPVEARALEAGRPAVKSAPRRLPLDAVPVKAPAAGSRRASPTALIPLPTAPPSPVAARPYKPASSKAAAAKAPKSALTALIPLPTPPTSPVAARPYAPAPRAKRAAAASSRTLGREFKAKGLRVEGTETWPLRVVLARPGQTFRRGSAALRPGLKAGLRGFAAVMRRHRGLRVRLWVRGHTDSDGRRSFNMKLSEQRALAARQALLALGLDRSVIAIVPCGPDQPLSADESPAGMAMNRRVELEVNPPGQP